ncbi:MAG: hypothetical protein GDA56_10760 [Hormoscilla sp. GM7CHS1pb]|nr:hypothetical protein [Hormoscilla sp. GM7CHS1pb]
MSVIYVTYKDWEGGYYWPGLLEYNFRSRSVAQPYPSRERSHTLVELVELEKVCWTWSKSEIYPFKSRWF